WRPRRDAPGTGSGPVNRRVTAAAEPPRGTLKPAGAFPVMPRWCLPAAHTSNRTPEWNLAMLVRRIELRQARGEEARQLLRREWLTTNGLGGYASGTISGSVAWRYHGLLIAALQGPFGRMVML